MSGQPEAAPQRLRHVVLFRFRDGTSAGDVAAVEAAFAALPSRVLDEAGQPLVRDFEWGTDVSPEGLADGFTHCFLLTFVDAAARDRYLEHPAHQEFVAQVLPHLDKPLVVDYQLRR